LGLANGLADGEALRARARAAADPLAKRPLGALTVTKRLMRDAEKIAALMDTEGAEFAARLQTAEAREAFMAFAERRAPDFSKVG
jgi:enoyl-CoA hydratase/carnithine racemase